MAKSFFERLTGSIRIREEGAAKEALSRAEKPAKPKEVKQKQAKRSLSGEGSLLRRIRQKDALPEPSEEEPEVEEIEEEEEKSEPPAVSSKEEPLGDAAEEKPDEEIRGIEAHQHEEREDDAEGQLTLDIYDNGAYYTAQSTIAGVRPEDVDISISGDTVTIRGVRRQQHEVNEDRYYARELYWGKFSRSVVLPEEIDEEKVDASLKNGLLTVKLPKKSYGSTRKVKIRSE